MTGIGQPQYRCRDISQSRSRKLIAGAAAAVLLEPGDDRRLGLRAAQAVEARIGVHERPVARVGELAVAVGVAR